MPRGAIALVLFAAGLAVSLPGSVSGRSAAGSPVEAFVQACPPAADIAQIDSELTLSFEQDPTAGTVVCTAAQSGRDLTRVQERAYQALRLMRRAEYARPLPWTGSSLWGWFTNAIRGIRFRGDIGNSYCCEPSNTINIQTSAVVAPPPFPELGNRFMHPDYQIGLNNLDSLLAHEARHNEGKPHTCGNADQTLAEGGAYAIAFDLSLWNALYSGSFYDEDGYRSRYQNASFLGAWVQLPSICTAPTADVSVQTQPSSNSIVVGDSFALTSTIGNAGPGDSPQTWFAIDIPEGTTLEGSTASQGSCMVVAGERLSCELGAVAAGARVTVALTLRAQAAGTIQYGTFESKTSKWMAYAIGAVKDFDPTCSCPSPNNQATVGFTIAPKATTTAPTPTTPAPLPKVTVTVTVKGKGRITGRGINCTTTCKASVVRGRSLTLRARAASGYRFAGWSGACRGVNACTFVPKTAAKVTATFRKR
jgi:hypothetical protein